MNSIIRDEKQALRALGIIHEFARKYFQLAYEFMQQIQNLSSWELMKQRLRNTSDIGIKTDILENFIASSHICNNRECPIFNPIDDLNSALNHMRYTTLEEAEEEYGSETVDFKNFKQQYFELLNKITEVLKDTYILYTTRSTNRFERKFDEDVMRNMLLFAKESKETGQVAVSTVGPFENVIKDTMKRALPSFFKEDKKKTEKLPKEQEREVYKEIGMKNVERIEAQLGSNLEKIRRDKEE